MKIKNMLLPLSLCGLVAGCTLPNNNVVNVLFDGTIVPPPAVFSGQMRGVEFGLDYLKSENYAGWDGACPGAVKDAHTNVRNLAAQGVPAIAIVNEQATALNILGTIVAVGRTIPAGGFLFIGFSGHGGQRPDKNGDEEDGMDETLLAYDAEIVDDTIGVALSQLPADINVVFWVDACNSGTSFRGAELAREVVKLANYFDLKCNLLYFGACEDGRVAWGTQGGGAFTNAKWRTFRRGMTWADWFTAWYDAMPADQKPVMEEWGVSFVDQIAFCPGCYLESDEPGEDCDACEDEDEDACEDSCGDDQ